MLTFLLSITEEGNQSKTEHIYKTYHDDMIRFARYRLRIAGCVNYEIDAEDAVQNTFIRIIKHISNIDKVDEKKEKAYIFVMLKNECLRLLADIRKCECEVELTDDISDGDFFEKLSLKLNYERVIEEIKKLDDIYSIPLMFKYVDDMPISKIAKIMSVPEKTVYTRISRAKRILLEKIGKESAELL